MPNERFDVVVVGAGAAGLAAALEAATHGARVVLLEKNAGLGGTSGISIGTFTASETIYQKRAGIRDSHDAHYADLDRFPVKPGAKDNLELRRLYVDNAADTLHWLVSLGLSFFGPSPEPPHTVPRLHAVLPRSSAYIRMVANAARAAGADIRTGAAAKELQVEGGRVVGVRTDSTELRAARGVILTTGDYAAGTALLRELAGEDYARIPAINPTNTGDGHVMARALGAYILNGHVAGAHMRFALPKTQALMERLPPTAFVGRMTAWAMKTLPKPLLKPFLNMYLTAYLAPERRLYQAGAILVNRGGERYTDERADPTFDTAKQEGGYGFIVLDEALASRFEQWPEFLSTAPGIAYAYMSDYKRYRPDIVHQAPTVEALAAKAGLRADALAKSVASAPVPMNTPPYYAMGPLHAWNMVIDGGLAITRQFEVLRQNDGVIPGLYAAGSAGQGGVLVPGHGQHIGWAFTSGRLAGRHVAKL